MRDDCGALQDQVDQLKAKLAAQDELRDAAVEYVEADLEIGTYRQKSFERMADDAPNVKRSRFGLAGLRYLAARDAAAKNGGAR